MAESLELTAAVDAWRGADFPLLAEDKGSKFVRITEREDCGREGLLPASLFTPTQYDLTEPRNAVYDIKRSWVRDFHVRAVLRANLGQSGERMSTHILEEMVYWAAYERKATTAYSAARIMVGAECDPETYISLWDNGEPYNSHGEIMDCFMNDAFGGIFSKDKLSIPAPENAWPSLVLNSTTNLFGGALAVISGGNRMDIAMVDDKYAFTPSNVVEIEGNLAIARLPHAEG